MNDPIVPDFDQVPRPHPLQRWRGCARAKEGDPGRLRLLRGSGFERPVGDRGGGRRCGNGAEECAALHVDSPSGRDARVTDCSMRYGDVQTLPPSGRHSHLSITAHIDLLRLAKQNGIAVPGAPELRRGGPADTEPCSFPPPRCSPHSGHSCATPRVTPAPGDPGCRPPPSRRRTDTDHHRATATDCGKGALDQPGSVPRTVSEDDPAGRGCPRILRKSRKRARPVHAARPRWVAPAAHTQVPGGCPGETPSVASDYGIDSLTLGRVDVFGATEAQSVVELPISFGVIPPGGIPYVEIAAPPAEDLLPNVVCDAEVGRSQPGLTDAKRSWGPVTGEPEHLQHFIPLVHNLDVNAGRPALTLSRRGRGRGLFTQPRFGWRWRRRARRGERENNNAGETAIHQEHAVEDAFAYTPVNALFAQDLFRRASCASADRCRCDSTRSVR